MFIKTIKYYENTKCTLKKGNKKSAQLSCVEVLHVNVGFFCAIEMHRKLNINAECECIAKYIWSHFLKFPLTYSMKFVKIYSINKISSQISVNFYT